MLNPPGLELNSPAVPATVAVDTFVRGFAPSPHRFVENYSRPFRADHPSL